jgi:hypothetical protein
LPRCGEGAGATRRWPDERTDGAALDRLLFGAALPEPDPSALDAVVSARIDERAFILRQADRQKVLLPMADALGTDLIPESAEPLVSRVRRMRLNHRAILADAAQLFEARHVNHAFLRGFDVEAAYPDGYQRQQHDLDPVLPDIDSLWRLVPALESLGFATHGLVLRRDRDGRLSGLATFRRPVPGLDRRAQITLDFTIGALPLHWSSAVQLDERFWGRRRRAPDGVVRFPSHADAVLVQLAELVERRRIGARDCLDMAMLLRRLDEDGRTQLTEWVADHHLGYEAARVALALRRVDAAKAFEPELAALRALGARASRRQLAGPRPVRLAAMHDYPCSLRDHGRRRAIRVAVRSVARDLLTRRRMHPLLRSAATRVGASVDAERLVTEGSHVAFAPVAPRPFGPVHWRRAADAKVLVTPLGTFLPMPLSTVDMAVLERVRRSCGEPAG